MLFHHVYTFYDYPVFSYKHANDLAFLAFVLACAAVGGVVAVAA